MAGCGRLPEESIRPTRAALGEAERHGGQEYAPAALDSAQTWFARAQTLNHDVPRTWYGKPQTDRIRAALQESERWSTLALAQADSLHRQRVSDDQIRLAFMEERLDALRNGLHQVSDRRKNRGLVRTLEVDLEEARLWLDRADPAPAESLFVRMEERFYELEDRLQADTRRFSSAESLARWGEWIDRGLRASASGKNLLVVEKESRQSYLVRNRAVVETFRVELGVEGTKEKTRQGDLATPEGLYTITKKKENGATKYHKALLLDYPNQEDMERFRRFLRSGRLPSQSRPGGLIEIHGDGGRGTDWTLGCLALANDDMDSLFRRMSVGDKVVIVGRVPDRFRQVLR